MSYIWMRQKALQSLESSRRVMSHVLYLCIVTNWSHVWMRHLKQQSLESCRFVIRHVHIHTYIVTNWSHVTYMNAHGERPSLDFCRCAIRYVHMYMYCHELESWHIHECAMKSGSLWSDWDLWSDMSLYIYVLSRTRVTLHLRMRHEYMCCHELESRYIYECAMKSSRLSTFVIF